MKLYCTVSSERATKGQGGQWLIMQVKGENQKNIISLVITQKSKSEHLIRVYNSENLLSNSWWCPDAMEAISIDDTLENVIKELKGERQKGEIITNIDEMGKDKAMFED